MAEPLVRVENLVKYFPVYERGIVTRKKVGDVHAVDGLSLNIERAQTVGLVGESGCGKTTAGKVILQLIPLDEGEVFFEGKPVHQTLEKGSTEEKKYIRRNMQMVFQNPYGSLDPRMTVFDIISEAFIIHKHVPQKEWKDHVYSLLRQVGLEEYHAERYPHEFSGGQRQRISIARALATDPKFIVADEPVSSLDVSVRAQILTLLEDLQKKEGISFLYISHDLSSVRQVSQFVAVMYLGKLMEYAPVDEIFQAPLNPYTIALLSAVPVPDPERKINRIILQGDVPSPINPPSGCRFHPRCAYATQKCTDEDPTWRELRPGHFVACHYAEKFLSS
ncbi:MAG: ATP-binding cassette domain-containing protein [Thaumarchaeota archaeon]|nr:ATP-binding cassette domain-containing protein [Nitrososphaerota archaeon]